MSTIKFGKTTLTTDHAASSYGIPVLVDSEGNAYGREDKLPKEFGHHTGGMQVAMSASLHGMRKHPLVIAFLGS